MARVNIVKQTKVGGNPRKEHPSSTAVSFFNSSSKRDTSPVPFQTVKLISLERLSGRLLLSRLPLEQQGPIHHYVKLRIRLRLVHQNALAIGRHLEWRSGVHRDSQGK